MLEEAVQENLGMAMVYTLISAAQEWVQVRRAGGGGVGQRGQRVQGWVALCPTACHPQHPPPHVLPCAPPLRSPQDKAAGMAVPVADPEAEEKRRREKEEERLAEMRRHGTPVTPEAFAEWRKRFDAEQAAARAKVEGGKEEDKKRPTGKQWFLQQEAAHIEVRARAPGPEPRGVAHAGLRRWGHARGTAVASLQQASHAIRAPQIEEPELEPDEEDGEDGRENWEWAEEAEPGEEEDLGFEEDEVRLAAGAAGGDCNPGLEGRVLGAARVLQSLQSPQLPGRALPPTLPLPPSPCLPRCRTTTRTCWMSCWPARPAEPPPALPSYARATPPPRRQPSVTPCFEQSGV